jgi:hypothetical protein
MVIARRPARVAREAAPGRLALAVIGAGVAVAPPTVVAGVEEPTATGVEEPTATDAGVEVVLETGKGAPLLVTTALPRLLEGKCRSK